jgi:hypothetical protein
MDPVPVSIVPSPETQAKMAAEDAKGGKTKRKKKLQNSEQPSEQPADKPPLAKVVPPQGGPLLLLSTQTARTEPESAAPSQPLEFRPLKSAMPQFAPPPAPAPVAAGSDPVRRVTSMGGDAPTPAAAAAPTPLLHSSGKSDALPRAAQAFASENSLPVAPVLRDMAVDSEPPLQLPASVPLPRPRPKF